MRTARRIEAFLLARIFALEIKLLHELNCTTGDATDVSETFPPVGHRKKPEFRTD